MTTVLGPTGGRHPAHRSSFSREFSVVPGRKSADFIESAGEPKIDPLGDTKTAPLLDTC